MGISDMLHEGYAPGAGAALVGNVDYISPGFQGLFKEPFSYSITITVGASTTASGECSIQNDSYFVWTQGSCTIWDSATQNTTNLQPAVAPILVRIFDSSSGKQLQDRAIPISSQFGTGLQPVVFLFRAKVFLPGGQIQAEITNQVAAGQTVRLVFTGFKIYKVADSAGPV